MPSLRASRVTQLKRGSRLVLQLLKGLLLVGCVFPHLRPSEQDVVIESWCREVLDVLSIRLNLRGEWPPEKVSSVMFVANHVSWLDILAINACRRVRFVAKSEVRQWPLVGWMAARTGTIFLKRTSPREWARVTKSVSASLRHGDCIGLFPEETTSDGSDLHTYHSGLLESAVASEALIWPVGISYHRFDGSLDTDIACSDSQSLASSIVNVLARPATQVRLAFTDPVESSSGDRRELTAWCHQSIEQSLAGYLPPTRTSPYPLQYPTDESLPPLTAA
ncbi:MAG: 1-acyl-sn-glycerol-3-phosphate acyltransferase [Nitrospira sp.]|nr:MAG: 1-acyl-sn-glycerol-3-phosphate acyltransferase [Nitrospira sp.]